VKAKVFLGVLLLDKKKFFYNLLRSLMCVDGSLVSGLEDILEMVIYSSLNPLEIN
jgi:hypothetical protein